MTDLLRNARVFEVDQPSTQEYKKRRVLEVLGPPPPNLVFVPIDFTRQQASAALRHAGYSAARKTFFIWEGVSMYLTEETVRNFLRDISSHPLLSTQPPAPGGNQYLIQKVQAWLSGTPSSTSSDSALDQAATSLGQAAAGSNG